MTDHVDVPGWPVVTIQLNDDTDVQVDGVPVVVGPGVNARQAAIESVVGTAQVLGRPVRAEAIEPDGTLYPLIVEPDGTVRSAGPEIPVNGGRKGRGRRKSGATGETSTPRVAARPEASVPPPTRATAAPAQDPRPLVTPVAAAEVAPTAASEPDYGPPAEPAATGLNWTPPPTETEAPAPPPPPVEASPSPEPPPPPAVVPVPRATPAPQPANSPPPQPTRAPDPVSAEPRRPVLEKPSVTEELPAQPAPAPAPDAEAATGQELIPKPNALQKDALRRINAAIAAGDNVNALAIAGQLDADSENEGDAAAALAAREIHAYVAIRAGQAQVAVKLFAEAAVARATHDKRIGAGSATTPDRWSWRLAQNAHYCWLQIKDPEDAYGLSPAVLGAYSAIGAADAPAAEAARGYAEQMRRILVLS